jgi:hypothetical protein
MSIMTSKENIRPLLNSYPLSSARLYKLKKGEKVFTKWGDQTVPKTERKQRKLNQS